MFYLSHLKDLKENYFMLICMPLMYIFFLRSLYLFIMNKADKFLFYQ